MGYKWPLHEKVIKSLDFRKLQRKTHEHFISSHLDGYHPSIYETNTHAHTPGHTGDGNRDEKTVSYYSTSMHEY